MASLKRLGFFWGDEKITVVDFDKNAPVQVVSSPIGSKTSTPSPFSSSLTEEIQITAILKKLLEDNRIKGNNFYVSLPMKEIILRSFVIPFVKSDDIQNAIKFEAKKYIPFDIQDLSYVFHTIPFMEGQVKRLQVIFFAARKEVLSRYERIFKQLNATATYGEPYIVSLSKALLYRKEIKATDHLAFLILDKTLGRICFIDKGIPQFIREFPVSFSSSQSEETNDSLEALNLKIVNEVGNSFDFYTRQFSGDRIEQVFVSSDFIQKDLIESLEAELKLRITKFSPVIQSGLGQSNDMDAIYAMGACVAPPIESLSKFNFLEEAPKPRSENKIIAAISIYKVTIFTFLACAVCLALVNVFFQMQLTLAKHELDQIDTKVGIYSTETPDAIQADVQSNVDKLTQYKNIRTKSDVASIILLLASHLPKNTLLSSLTINYDQGDSVSSHVTIDMRGDVIIEDPNEQIAMVNQVYSDLKNDKDLSHFVSTVNLVSFNPEMYNGRQVTAFNIHCS